MKITYKQILTKKDFLPFYVYDYETIKGQILKLKKYLPSNVKVFYSVKANPNIAILRIMKNFGLSAEIVSLGEFAAAQKVGFKAKEILFAGSTKSDEELLVAVKKKIGLISVESESEIERLNKIAKRIAKKADILLRFNLRPVDDIALDDIFSIFSYGLSVKQAERFFKNKFEFKNINLKGVHFYEHSRVYDFRLLIKRVEVFFSFIKAAERKFNLDFEIIDIGGGFGSNVLKELSALYFCRDLKRVIKKYDFGRKKIILELGRYFIAKAGNCVTEIIEDRKNGGVNFLVVKGLLNYINRTFADSKIRQRFSMVANEVSVKILPPRRRKLFPYVISGQMSSLSDILGKTYKSFSRLSRPEAGDFLIIEGVGGYGLTQAFVLFGSRPITAEFILVNNKLELIKNKIKSEDLLTYQKIPPALNKKSNYDKK